MKKYNKPVAWRFEKEEYVDFELACLTGSIEVGRRLTIVEVMRGMMKLFVENKVFRSIVMKYLKK